MHFRTVVVGVLIVSEWVVCLWKRLGMEMQGRVDVCWSEGVALVQANRRTGVP